MSRIAVLMIVVCLTAGCSPTSLTFSHTGEIRATINSIDADKTADVVKKIKSDMEAACPEPWTLTLHPTVEKYAASTIDKYQSVRLESLGLKDVMGVFGLIKRFLIWHTITVVGSCNNKRAPQ